jgi:hypothetical protein
MPSILSRRADQSAQNETAYQTLCKNLPNQPTKIATLEIDQTSSKRTGTQKATMPVAFCIPANRQPQATGGWLQAR